MVDVLLAAYNGEKYIKEQIESILNQTYKDINLIACDDKSTDSTYDILKQYEQKYDNVTVYRNDENLGYVKNFEKLISLSASEYFMLSDQDDVWKSGKVQKSLDALLEHEVDLVFTDLEVVDEKLNPITPSFNKYGRIYPNDIKGIENILIKNMATGCTILADGRIKENLLPFITLDKTKFIHDWLILVVAMMGRGFYYLDAPTILYRQHGNNNIGFKHKKKIRRRDLIKKAAAAKYKFLSTRVEYGEYLNERYPNTFDGVLEYYDSLKKSKFINFRFADFFKYFASEKGKTKFLYFIMMHTPMYLLRYRQMNE